MKTDRQEWMLAALKRYEAPLVRYATRITGDLEQARDVVQETFLKLWKAKRSEVEHKLAPWLYTVCRNQALDVRKKEKRMVNIATEDELGAAAKRLAPSRPETSAGESRSQLAALLETLPPRQQEVIRLKFQENLSYKEIAKVTGLTTTNVGYLIHTGIKSMRDGVAAAETRDAGKRGGK